MWRGSVEMGVGMEKGCREGVWVWRGGVERKGLYEEGK